MRIVSISGRTVQRIVYLTATRSKISASVVNSWGVSASETYRSSILVDGDHGFATVVLDLVVERTDEWDLLIGSDVIGVYSGIYQSGGNQDSTPTPLLDTRMHQEGVPDIMSPYIHTGQCELEHRASMHESVDFARGEAITVTDFHDVDGFDNDLSTSSAGRHQYAEDNAFGMGGSRCTDGQPSPEDLLSYGDGPSGESCSLVANIMNEMLLSRVSCGGVASVFTDNVDVLYGMSMQHGISVPPKSNADSLHSVLLTHVLLGDCFRAHRTGGVHNSNESQSVSQCVSMACTYASGKSLSLECLRFIQSYTGRVTHLPLDRLVIIVKALGYKGASTRPRVVSFLNGFIVRMEGSLSILDVVKTLPEAYILSVARAHCIPTSKRDTLKDVKCKVQEHFKEGVCALLPPAIPPESIIDDSATQRARMKWMDDYLLSMDSLVGRMGHRACKRLITLHGLEGDMATHRGCRKIIRAYIAKLRKGKRQEEYVRARAADRQDERLEEAADFARQVADVQTEWPKVVNNNLKEKLLRDFMLETGCESLRTCTCAVCSASRPVRDVRMISHDEYELNCIKPIPGSEADVMGFWPGTQILLPFHDGPLRGLMIDMHGVESINNGSCMLSVCLQCLKDIKQDVVPKFSLANGLYLGDIPTELSDLTIIEESMIALCRSKCYIFQLKED
ncbi:uncharacterized protein ARMOST_20330 [Armillaria ostoyae]|uniref:DUF6570 domain-containing protein n=1 Tax=Armillaria ostoyae TaxID=47428 RepID=A0A284S722_ARMOS|nr:uncharacterized protein ARMOST_20330 [Armillaria ostoyae]